MSARRSSRAGHGRHGDVLNNRQTGSPTSILERFAVGAGGVPVR